MSWIFTPIAASGVANCLENFAMEGAYVENENVDFLRPEYREIYVMLKQELDLYRNKGLKEQQLRWPLRELACRAGVPIQSLSSTEIAQIKKAPHAKLKTAVYKKPVHIVGDRGVQRPVHLRRSQVDQQPEVHIRPTGFGRKAESA